MLHMHNYCAAKGVSKFVSVRESENTSLKSKQQSSVNSAKFNYYWKAQ